ncbi:hypothetical protein HUT06_39345 [Actinomadura sp. NAK00032]|uniref:hypothetical protein n=1 Tax=Actinomadura sp. NAK00032 TaxID=2742128 RepID=UPI001590CD44|nr:hypothetical protein [Actinomadura sp. NAK00032]QKW39348.1 hypothetical protein HUT06_39345 [Actinomadura sp. NAK00032]
MKRRTDRAIAISAVVAVAVVPTAVLMVVKVGGDSAKDAGSMPPAAVMARQDQTNPNGAASGTVSPGATAPPKTGAGRSPAPGAPASGNGAVPHGLPTAPPQPGPSLHSFTRKTEMKVALGEGGDYKHAVETASFTLWPKFAMSATGVTKTVLDGEASKITQKVIVSGNVLKGFDGAKWTQSTLSAAQLSELQNGSDPRQFTFMIGTLPGTTASEPDASGRTRFAAQALMSSVYALLPQDAAALLRPVLPDSTGCGIDLWADSSARPTTIRLAAQAPGAALDGTMSFGSYR